MEARELAQAAVALPGQPHLDPPAVVAAAAALDQAGLLAARNQRHDAVVLGLQALGELADRRPLPAGKPLIWRRS